MSNDPPFRRIAIVGVGLIGGSITLAAKRKWPSIDVAGIGARDDLSGIAGAGLIVLSAPVLANIRILEQIPAHAASDAVVTDTGSTKRRIVAAAAASPALTFIGGHPMAGGARGGAAHARDDVFDGRPWILTPQPGHAAPAVARLESFVAGLGA